MSLSFKLPDLGEGVHEAEILAVCVTQGQQISEGDIILEVETDKAAVEIPSPATGTVSQIEVNVGDFAKVGDTLIIFDEEANATQATDEPSQPSKPMAHALPVPAAPSTRRIARELGVDLRLVSPTGKGGIVSSEDVQNYVATLDKTNNSTPMKSQDKATATNVDDSSKWGSIERLPFRSIRRATARQMSTSWAEIPHVYCQDTVDITRLEQFRQKHKAEIEQIGGRLTLTVFALKAVISGLKNFPYFNASLDTEAQEIILKHYFHIGIAVDSGKGLMVPVIRDVDRKSIREIAIELQDITQRVKTGKHRRQEMVGATFTITNAGALGGSTFTAIINHPQVAILGLGQGRMQATVVKNDQGDDEIVPRLIMPIVLGFDHRVVDGADGIRFLRSIITALEDPDELLLGMV